MIKNLNFGVAERFDEFCFIELPTHVFGFSGGGDLSTLIIMTEHGLMMFYIWVLFISHISFSIILTNGDLLYWRINLGFWYDRRSSNPLRAEFFCKMNMYLQFIPIIHIKTAQVVEIHL